MAPPCRAAWYQARATAVVLVQGHVARNSSLRTSEGSIASRREVVWRRPGAVALLLRTLSRLSGGSRWKIRLVVSGPPARPSAGDTPCVAPPPWSRVVYYSWSDCPPPPLPRPFPPLALGSAACHQYLDTGGSPWSSPSPAVCPVGCCVGVVAASSPGEVRAAAPLDFVHAVPSCLANLV